MNTLETLFTQTIIHAVGWALIHFIWQGALIAALAAAALSLLRESAAALRCKIATWAMLLMLAAFVGTIILSSFAPSRSEVGRVLQESVAKFDTQKRIAANSFDQSTPLAAASQARAGEMLAAQPVAFQQWAKERLIIFLPWLVLFWLSGVLIFAVRTLGGWTLTQRLKRRQTNAVTQVWRETLVHLARQVNVSRPVRLLESAIIEVPMIVGWLRPVILVPASAFVCLSAPQLEAIVAHELAHIKRHDYLANLLQALVEAVLFYHPAVWWVSRQIRIEREHACDDLAVAVSGDALVYARALAEMEGLRGSHAIRSFAVAISGDGSLASRIRRLVGVSPQSQNRSSSLLAGSLIAIALFTTLGYARIVLSEARKEATRRAESADVSVNDKAPREAETLRLTPSQSRSREAAANIARDDVTGEDTEARRVALTALGDHAGTVVVMNPQTGRVYAIVNQEWALRRGWNPASTIKLVTALAALEEKAIDPAQLIRVSAKAPPLALTKALAISDNPYFKFVGERLNAERFIGYAQQLGLGEQTGINAADENAGRVPLAQTGMNAGRMGAYAENFEVTPIQLATLVAALCNGGALVVPHVPRTPQETADFETRVRRRLAIAPENLQQVVRGMVAAVDYGTAQTAQNPAQKVAGKTGTSLLQQGARIGLFASFAPINDPRVVVVVGIHEPDASGAIAAGIAGKIYSTLRR